MNYNSITHSIQLEVPQFITDAEIENIVKLAKNTGKGLVVDVGATRIPRLSTQVGKMPLAVAIMYHSNTHIIVEEEVEPIEEIIMSEVGQYIAKLTTKYNNEFGDCGSWTTC